MRGSSYAYETSLSPRVAAKGRLMETPTHFANFQIFQTRRS